MRAPALVPVTVRFCTILPTSETIMRRIDWGDDVALPVFGSLPLLFVIGAAIARMWGS